jgi:hypothetical protein
MRKVTEVLGDAHSHEPNHPFGRPFVSGYQLAIELQRRHPDTVLSLGKLVGGAGTGSPNSLAQHLADELSRQIRKHDRAYPVEGGLLWRRHSRAIRYRDNDGRDIDSTVAEAGYDMALFRLRDSE